MLLRPASRSAADREFGVTIGRRTKGGQGRISTMCAPGAHYFHQAPKNGGSFSRIRPHERSWRKASMARRSTALHEVPRGEFEQRALAPAPPSFTAPDAGAAGSVSYYLY